MTDAQREDDAYRFIVDEIESVPHLEALLLLWNSRPQQWSGEALAKRLYISGEVTRRLLQDLVRQGLIATTPGSGQLYWYEGKLEERDRVIELVDRTYRREVVRVSTAIHLKGSSAVRDFARAFRFTKERE